MKKAKRILVLLMIFIAAFGTSAFAFEDIKGHQAENAIMELYQAGILNGVDAKHFAPNRPLTIAEAIKLYVTAFDLNLDHIRFIKEPVITDYYDKIKANAWYADEMIIAYHNGIQFPRDVNPEQEMTREEFAYFLHQILTHKAEFATILIWNEYEDIDEVNESYSPGINILITLGIVDLNEERKFMPKDSIKRADAAQMIYKALNFLKSVKEKPQVTIENVQFVVEPVTEAVNKVTLIWSEKPNPGYRITIDRIEFFENTATIYYSLHEPDPDKVYPQVITDAKAFTYLDAKYTVQIKNNSGYRYPHEIPIEPIEGSVSPES